MMMTVNVFSSEISYIHSTLSVNCLLDTSYAAYAVVNKQVLPRPLVGARLSAPAVSYLLRSSGLLSISRQNVLLHVCLPTYLLHPISRKYADT